MPLGIVLITINYNQNLKKWKGEIINSYPVDFMPSRALVRKIIEIIHNSTDKINCETEETLELKYRDKIILVQRIIVHPNKKEELFVVILQPKEALNVQKYYNILVSIFPHCDSQPISKYPNQFTEYAEHFFPKSHRRKILFIGLRSAGKTCIKKSFFDGVDPSKLLGEYSPEPTVGLAHFVYSWLDAEVGIIDSSGQEFDRYVSPANDFERKIAFEEADVILYIFDITHWQEDHNIVLKNLEKVISTKKIFAGKGKIYAFCHKIDLLKGSNEDKSKYFLQIKQQIEQKYHIKTIFTSIQPNLIHTLFRSMQIILNELSIIGGTLEAFCEDIIKDQKTSAVLLFNESNAVISQKSTPDLDVYNFTNISALVRNQIKLLTNSPELGDLDYSIIYTLSGFALIIKSIQLIKYGISTLAFLSRNINRKSLSQILIKLEQRLSFEIQKEKYL
ncbi:GTPase domain-containing protein [Candidatus Harpocratesius sp.]